MSSKTSFLASPPGHLLTSAPALGVDCRTEVRQNVCSQESLREKYLPNSLAEVGLRRTLKGADEVTREFKGWQLHSDRKAKEPPWFLSLKLAAGMQQSLSGGSTKGAIPKNASMPENMPHV